MFWSRKDKRKPQKEVTEEECICAAQLVAGSLAADIFDSRTSGAYRVFALDPELAASCNVTDVASTRTQNTTDREDDGNRGGDDSATRLFVSLSFLWSVLDCWPTTGCSSIREHVRALADSLEYYVGLAAALVQAGKTLVAHGGKSEDPAHPSVCDQLIDKWIKKTAVGFEHLTFEALCLHLSCVLEDSEAEAKSVREVLDRVCSKVADTIQGNLTVLGGGLERVDIPNFPSFLFDAYAAKDGLLNDDGAVKKTLLQCLLADAAHSGDVELKAALDILTNQHPRIAIPPLPGDTSYTRLQSALARGRHFCFQPSNPSNQGEDGVVFLRISGDVLMWIVLVIQNKFWLRDVVKEGPYEKSVVAKWRDSIAHLPATVVDADGKEHTLHYVRILVTANRVGDAYFATPPKNDKEYAERMKKLNGRIDVLGRANAAFVGSDPNDFDKISAFASDWVDKELKKELTKPPTRNPDYLKAGKRAEELLAGLFNGLPAVPPQRGRVLGEISVGEVNCF